MALVTIFASIASSSGSARPITPVQHPGGEQPHQLVVEAEVEAALARITLASGTAAQLVVDAPALVALGAEHVQTAGAAHLVALGVGLDLEVLEQLVVPGQCGGAIGLELLGHLVERQRQGELVDEQVGRDALVDHGLTGEPLGVAAELDVDATTGHVGGDGDRGAGARPG